jgi:hypothetical protein
LSTKFLFTVDSQRPYPEVASLYAAIFVPNDHTIFAWSMPGDKQTPEVPPPLSGLFQGSFGSNIG